MRPGYIAASVPNCSAITRGEWLGSMMPPEPSRIELVWAPTWAMSTLVADEAMDGRLWCSAYQTRGYPRSSALRASVTLAAKLSLAVWPRPRGARSRMASRMRIRRSPLPATTNPRDDLPIPPVPLASGVALRDDPRCHAKHLRRAG